MLNRPAICPLCGQVMKKNPDERQPSSSGEQEEDVFESQPAAMAFLGEIILGILLFAVIIGLIILLKVWHRCVSRQYRLTTQRLFVQQGLIAKNSQELELYRIKDVTVSQSLLQRLLGYGSITVLSDDDSNPRLELVGIRNPTEVKETIRSHYRAARKREGVRPTEFMSP